MTARIDQLRRTLAQLDQDITDAVADGDVIEGDRDWWRMNNAAEELACQIESLEEERQNRELAARST